MTIKTVGELIAALSHFQPDEPVRLLVKRGLMEGVSGPIQKVAGRVVLIPTNERK